MGLITRMKKLSRGCVERHVGLEFELVCMHDASFVSFSHPDPSSLIPDNKINNVRGGAFMSRKLPVKMWTTDPAAL